MNSRLASLGVVVIFVGFIVVFLGVIAAPGGSSSTGGFILIGPIPIVFGNGPNSGTLATVALVITAAMVGVYLLSFLYWRSGRWREADVRRESGGCYLDGASEVALPVGSWQKWTVFGSCV